MPKFSLLIGTKNRGDEIRYCLFSLLEQSYTDYEIIIVDQSDDNNTENVVKDLSSSKIYYYHSTSSGLSRGRNIGLRLAKGEYICLIDDDACYKKDYLMQIDNHVNKNGNRTVISGYIWDAVRNRPFVEYKLLSGEILSRRQILRYCPSPGLTIPASLVDIVGGFDEDFGVGASYGSCEETDLLLRATKENFRVMYFDNVKVIHPHEHAASNLQGNQRTAKKTYQYALGYGALVKKHNKSDGLLFLFIPTLEVLAKDIAKIMLRRNFAKDEFKGHIDGFIKYK